MTNWWPELADVRAAAEKGRLMLGDCETCDQVHYYPRELCPHCLSPAGRRSASGQGVIYSLSVLRRGPQAPSAVVYVTLKEGLKVLGRMEPEAIDRVAIGDAVCLSHIDQTDDGLVPVFRAS